MIKNKKTDVLLSKFKLKYRVIFSNKNFKTICENHFDNKMGFAAFTLGLVQNQLGEKRALKHIQINSSNWIRILSDIYDSKDIISVYKQLKLNPIILLENIEKSFDCFDTVINKIVHYLKSEQLDIGISDNQIRHLLKCCFGYILYNCIDCKIPYSLQDILADPEYDQKFLMILNNTKLFATAKKSILGSCNQKVNNLIQLLLGISRDLNYDK